MATKTSAATAPIFRSTSSYISRQARRSHVCRACSAALSEARFSTVLNGQTWLFQLPQAAAVAVPRVQTFSTSRIHQKKSSTNPKSPRKSPAVGSSTTAEHIPDNKHSRKVDAEPDPYDHSELQTAIDQAIARLKDALTKTRDAGRVSVQMINDLPVELSHKGSPSTSPSSSASSGGNTKGGSSVQNQHNSSRTRVKIGDIATVAPRGGRTMQVYIAEESHTKPVSGAIQASPYSLVPQPDPQNPLLLNVPVPPQTAETRAAAVAEAKKCFDRAGLDVRNARGDAQKRHKKMEQAKLVVPDELRKAHKSMEDVTRKGQDEVKRVYDAAVKALQNV